MKISVHRERASISPSGYKIFTAVFTLPGPLLPELLTHRECSRNLTSLRAMPVATALKLTGFRPAHLGRAQPGMQAMEEELDEGHRKTILGDWAELEEKAKAIAERHAKLGLAKQIANRPLAPYMYVRGVLTATSQEPHAWPFANLLHLRAKSSKVEPHMHEFAWCLADAISDTRWESLSPGEWHLPFVTNKEQMLTPKKDSIQLALASAMRCARASYNKLDGKVSSIEEDANDALVKLLDNADVNNLSKSMQQGIDLHGSPFEHQARCPMEQHVTTITIQHTPEGPKTKTSYTEAFSSGNFRGWEQFRHVLGIKPGTFTDADYQKGRLRALRG